MRIDARQCNTENSPCHRNTLFGHVARLPEDVPAHKALSCKSFYLKAYHQAASVIVTLVVLVTDELARSGVTTIYHLWISGGALSVMVIAAKR